MLPPSTPVRLHCVPTRAISIHVARADVTHCAVRAHRWRVTRPRLPPKALALAEKSGNFPMVSTCWPSSGILAVSLGDYPAAHPHLGRLTPWSPARAWASRALSSSCRTRSSAGRPWGIPALPRRNLRRAARTRAGTGPHVGAGDRGQCRAHLARQPASRGAGRLRSGACRALALPMPFRAWPDACLTQGGSPAGGAAHRRRGSFRPAWRTSNGSAPRSGRPRLAGNVASAPLPFPERAHPDPARWRSDRTVPYDRRSLAAMFITVNTVPTHVGHIFRNSRAFQNGTAAVLWHTAGTHRVFQGAVTATGRPANVAPPAWLIPVTPSLVSGDPRPAGRTVSVVGLGPMPRCDAASSRSDA